MLADAETTEDAVLGGEPEGSDGRREGGDLQGPHAASSDQSHRVA